MVKHLIDKRKNIKIVGRYGVKFLDDMLLGIMPEDFILLGADTGAGKTELAYDIAFNNALEGKKIHLFALEAEKDEPYYRKLYKIISEKYYENIPFKKIDMSYRNYMSNKIDVDIYEQEAIKELDKYYNLTVHYRINEQADRYNFQINDLMYLVDYHVNRNDCDMVIIDHVDYFDLNLNQNENAQVSSIMQVLRMLNQTYKIPILVISHLRKRNSKHQLLPTVDDFMGTSNKAKQAKTIILMSVDHERSDPANSLYGTFFSIPKARIGGGENWLAASIMFNRKKNKYSDNYELYKIKNFGESVELLEKDNYPSYLKKEQVPF